MVETVFLLKTKEKNLGQKTNGLSFGPLAVWMFMLLYAQNISKAFLWF